MQLLEIQRYNGGFFFQKKSMGVIGEKKFMANLRLFTGFYISLR